MASPFASPDPIVVTLSAAPAPGSAPVCATCGGGGGGGGGGGAGSTAQLQTPAAQPTSPPPRWQAAMDLAKFDTLIFDCDGVLWQESSVIPGAPATLKRLHELGKRVLFATNNSGKSREAYAAKFRLLGFEQGLATPDTIFTSSQATAFHLSKLAAAGHFDKANQLVYIIGQNGIGIELEKEGIKFIEGSKVSHRQHNTHTQCDAITAPVSSLTRAIFFTFVRFCVHADVRPEALDESRAGRVGDGSEGQRLDAHTPASTPACFAQAVPFRCVCFSLLLCLLCVHLRCVAAAAACSKIGAVVVGIDDELTYTKMAYGLACLNRRHGGGEGGVLDRPCLFISTNQDANLPTAGHTLPGAGSCVAMMAVAAGRTATNIGKPETAMLNLAVEKSAQTIPPCTRRHAHRQLRAVIRPHSKENFG